jgi:hypothetical protein
MTINITHVVSLSGGAASFCVLKELLRRHGKENVVAAFCDTTIEDPDLYRFLDDIERVLKIKIVKLCDGRTPWQVFRDRKWHGNSRIAHCSEELKGKVFSKWLSQHYQPKDCILHFGFGASESRRLATARKNWFPYQCESILLEPPYLSREQMLQEIDGSGIDVPRLYELGFSHNNCGGYCCKAGQGHFNRLLRELPAVYAHHEQEQEQLFKEFPKLLPSLEKTTNGVKSYLSLRDFRLLIEIGCKPESGVGGCGCFSDFNFGKSK